MNSSDMFIARSAAPINPSRSRLRRWSDQSHGAPRNRWCTTSISVAAFTKSLYKEIDHPNGQASSKAGHFDITWPKGFVSPRTYEAIYPGQTHSKFGCLLGLFNRKVRTVKQQGLSFV